MYVYEGNAGQNYSRLFRSDDVATGAPVFTDLTSSNTGVARLRVRASATRSAGTTRSSTRRRDIPDIVYVGGAYSYGEPIANKRGVILSTDAGVTGTDMTFDGTDPMHPNGLHPDQHSLVTNPNNPFQFFETNDGGVMRSSGEFVDRSSWCDDPNRGLSGARLDRCKQMLSRIPSKLESLNKGLSTLQFQSLSVSPHNVEHPPGRHAGQRHLGDGRQPEEVAEHDDRRRRPVRLRRRDPRVPLPQLHGRVAGRELRQRRHRRLDLDRRSARRHGGEFYSPVISDPVVSKTMFAGTGRTAYRTKTAGLGTRTLAEANAVCNEWTGTFAEVVRRLGAARADRLTDAAWGDRARRRTSRAIERTKADTSTRVGRDDDRPRLHLEERRRRPGDRGHLDADRRRLATTRTASSSIYVDPANGNHAWISYSGFNSNTPATPGHVFEVTYDPATGTSTWIDRSYDLQDIPVTDLVRDDVTGNLYAASDFGVPAPRSRHDDLGRRRAGMPNVEVAGLTIVPGERMLYAATHGLSAWRLNLG